jgi:hypothetical protein
MMSPLSGTSFHLYRTIAEIARDGGPVKLQTIIKRRFVPSRIEFQRVPRASIFPMTEPDEYINAGISRVDMDLLDDPGVAAEPKVPRLVDRLPVSQEFLGVVQLVLHDMQTADAAKRTQEIGGDFEALKLAFLGLRLGDCQLVELALGKVQGNTAMADLIKARLMCETEWATFAGVFHTESKKTTIGEHNALVMAKALFRTFNIDV